MVVVLFCFKASRDEQLLYIHRFWIRHPKRTGLSYSKRHRGNQFASGNKPVQLYVTYLMKQGAVACPFCMQTAPRLPSRPSHFCKKSKLSDTGEILGTKYW